MSRNYFGTDGVRGTVGESPMTADFVLRLGYAAGKVLSGQGVHPSVLIGKDTRISGYMIEAALEAGFSAAGVDVLLCGPLPAPGVAYLTRALRLSAGVVISASHNPYPDNGIKFFSGDGFKLPDGTEAAIEAQMEQPMGCNEAASLGRARRVDDAGGRYIEFCKSTFPAELDLKGWRIVVDCAHGAAYNVAPPVFHELGADVISIGAEPNGTNINDGVGAMYAKHLKAAVVANKADIGIALDGDGDRLPMVDQRTTLARAASGITLFPQRLINVRLPKGYDWKANEAIRAAQAGTIAALGDGGRVLLRPSGTEPVLRVMVEAREADVADKHA